jgi:hypothetical protein
MFGWGRRRESLLQEFEEHIESETAENIERACRLKRHGARHEGSLATP